MKPFAYDKRHVFTCAFAATATLVAQAATLTEPCDLATVTPTTYETISCSASSTNTPYTLSADVSWTTQTLAINSGSMRFDFSDGNHTLGVKSLSINSATSPYVELKNCKVDGINTSWGGAFSAFSTKNASTDRTVVFDNTSVKNYHTFNGLKGRDGRLIITNGAKVASATIYLFGEMTDATYTNNFVHVSAGSTFLGSTTIWEKGGPGSSALMNNRVLVEGTGAEFGTSGNFSFATASSGNEVVARDSATLKWNNATVGSSANSKSNTIFATGTGTKVDGTGSLTIGTTVGADYNRVILADGADMTTQIYNGTIVGSSGSYNELVISNATLSRTYWVRAGASAGANHNRVKLYGNSSITTSTATYMFGAGQHNEWVFDNGSFWPSSNYSLKMSEANGLDGAFTGTASTNNTVKIVNGATLNAYDFTAHVSSMSNTVYVGADSTLRVPHDMTVRGDGNSVIISNGTLKTSRSNPGFWLGNSGTASTRFTEGGNRLIFQGTHPVFARVEPQHSSSARMSSNSILRFEVPPTGYPMYDAGEGSKTNAPIFQGVSPTFYGNGAIEFAGVEELAKSLAAAVDYQLSDQGIGLEQADPDVTLADIVARANVGMPRGSYAYLGSGNTLWLHVAPIRGLVMIIK